VNAPAGAPGDARARPRLVTTIVVAAALAFVFFVPIRTCRACNGIGTFIFKCTSCEGDGKQTVWEILTQPRD
jgi:DnaJ-class molecular chaperone